MSAEIEALAEQNDGCQRLMTVPGVGPIISSAVVAAIGNGAGFKQGRDCGAWLGLVPKQESTGDRTILGKISKPGNKYLRTLFVQAAHVVLVRRPSAAMRGLWPWIEQASSASSRYFLASLFNQLRLVLSQRREAKSFFNELRQHYAALEGYDVRRGYELCRVLQNKLEYCSGSKLRTGYFSPAVSRL